MAPIKNTRYLFKEYVVGYPEIGKSFDVDESDTIDLETVPLEGGFLLKCLAISVDPYLRGKMNKPTGKHYSAAFEPGKPLGNHGIAKVLRSDHNEIKTGDIIFGIIDYAEYQIKKEPSGFEVINNKYNIPWTVWTGVLGMPGKTAYFAWKEYNGAKKGDTAFITAGAGPVGSLVIQLAKLDGLKVISSAGSADKVKFLNDIGSDVSFNYKEKATTEVLAKEGPINVYWDNVGGETLEAAIDASAVGAHFIECGMISQYNAKEPYHIKNLSMIVFRQLKIFGFIYSSLTSKWNKEFREVMPKLVSEGKIKYHEDVRHGIKETGQAIIDQQRGDNIGKVVILVADE